jgi:hypothetical protein
MSAIYSFENFVDLILDLAAPVLDGVKASVEACPQAEKEYTEKLRNTLDKGVWESCQQRTAEPKKNVYMYPWSNMTMFRHTHGRKKDAWIYGQRPEKLSAE